MHYKPVTLKRRTMIFLLFSYYSLLIATITLMGVNSGWCFLHLYLYIVDVPDIQLQNSYDECCLESVV